jgi:hypothetical protein
MTALLSMTALDVVENMLAHRVALGVAFSVYLVGCAFWNIGARRLGVPYRRQVRYLVPACIVIGAAFCFVTVAASAIIVGVGFATFIAMKHSLLESEHDKGISSHMVVQQSPGWTLHRLASWVFSKRTVALVVEPVLSDLQLEFHEALSAGRPYKARWVQVRGYAVFWTHLGAQIPVSAARVLLALWRLV